MSDWTSWLESSVMGDPVPNEHDGGPVIHHVAAPWRGTVDKGDKRREVPERDLPVKVRLRGKS